MNYPILIKVLGILLTIEALGMIPSLLISIYDNSNDVLAFIISIAINLVLGFIMFRFPVKKKDIRIKEALSIVSIGWVLISIFGALPLVISGSVPSFVDALFEMISGFTTTGATIIKDIELLPRGILFWRSFSHWIGGMGILVFTVAILPALGVGSYQIFKAESPGPIADRIVPRIKDTAKILYIFYIGLTLFQIILLKFGGMDLYESIIHTFGTVGTGGISTRNESIGAFNSSYITIIISLFMILSGVSFSLFYQMSKGNWKEVFKNEELRLFLTIIGICVILITIDLGENIGRSLKDAFFQVSSIISTTGFNSVNFIEWSAFSKTILFTLMFIGGCAGSISGGIKNIRILVLFKLIKREMSKIFHPRAVIHVKVNDRVLSSDVIASIMSFFALYILIFVLGTIIISLEGIGLVGSSSAVASSIGNLGLRFDYANPTNIYSDFNNFSKLFLSFLMLFGRLELFTMLILFRPKFWSDEI